MTTAVYKERPILFSGAMVRALLDGSKTQTRRALSVQPLDVLPMEGDKAGKEWVSLIAREPKPEGTVFRCRFGLPGDRLWVRETWAYHPDFPELARRAIFRADPECEHDAERWRPSIHMPRWACRIDLEITGVRVERLQDISEADSVAEGISPWPLTERRAPKWQCPQHVRRFGDGNNVEDVAYEGFLTKDPREAYRGIWSAINGPGSWESDPWVWAIEFRRVS